MAIRLTIAWAASDTRLSIRGVLPLGSEIGTLTRVTLLTFLTQSVIVDAVRLKPCIVFCDCVPGTSVRAFIFWATLQSRRYEKLEADAPPRYAIFTYGSMRVRRHYLIQRTPQQEVGAPPASPHASPMQTPRVVMITTHENRVIGPQGLEMVARVWRDRQSA